jgi:hypothetical protein
VIDLLMALIGILALVAVGVLWVFISSLSKQENPRCGAT